MGAGGWVGGWLVGSLKGRCDVDVVRELSSLYLESPSLDPDEIRYG